MAYLINVWTFGKLVHEKVEVGPLDFGKNKIANINDKLLCTRSF